MIGTTVAQDYIIIIFAGIIFVYPLAAFSSGIVLIRFRTHRKSISDIVILAAHQDDCVISAGENAIEAIDAQCSVCILYLTRGSSRDDHERAMIRRKETIQVWSDVGVSNSCLEFLELPQSGIIGPSQITHSEQEYAIEQISSVLRKTKIGTSIFIPAEGESHIDHRTLRSIAYKSLKQVGRNDLCVFECPEYNSSYSLFCSPIRSICYIGRNIPLVSKFVPKSSRFNRANMISGGPASHLPYDSARMRKKLHLLRGFESEDGELLVKYFGNPDRFRRVYPHKWGGADRSCRLYYLNVFDKNISISIILFWISFWLFTWAAVAYLSHTLYGTSSMFKYVIYLIATIIVWYSFRKNHSVEKRVTSTVIVLSLVLAILLY